MKPNQERGPQRKQRRTHKQRSSSKSKRGTHTNFSKQKRSSGGTSVTGSWSGEARRGDGEVAPGDGVGGGGRRRCGRTTSPRSFSKTPGYLNLADSARLLRRRSRREGGRQEGNWRSSERRPPPSIVRVENGRWGTEQKPQPSPAQPRCLSEG